jgi:predicted nucleotidyltransferase
MEQTMPRLPSVYVRRSCGSSRVTYLNRDRAIEQLRLLAGRLFEERDDVQEVRLFGSLARREAVPGSDADILIVLRNHKEPRWFDRIAEFADAFSDTDIPVEVFPYTRAELKRLAESGSGLVKAAESGIRLAPRGNQQNATTTTF